MTYEAEATAFKKVVEQLATSYADLNTELEMDTGSNLLHFIFANELQNMYSTVEQFTFGITKTIVAI